MKYPNEDDCLSVEFRSCLNDISQSMCELRVSHHHVILQLPIDEVVLEMFFEDVASIEEYAQWVISSENKHQTHDRSIEFIDAVLSWTMRAEYISMNLMHYQYNPEYEIKTPMPDDHQTSLAYLCKVYVQCSSFIERYTDEEDDGEDDVSAPVEADKDKSSTQESISFGKDLVCIVAMFSFAWYCVFQLMSSSP